MPDEYEAPQRRRPVDRPTHRGERRGDVFVVGREIRDVAGRLPRPEAAAVLAQVECVEVRAPVGPVLREAALEEVVRPAVHVEHVDVVQWSPVAEQPAEHGWAGERTHHGRDDGSLLVLAERQGQLFERRPEDVGSPLLSHALSLASAAPEARRAPAPGTGRRGRRVRILSASMSAATSLPTPRRVQGTYYTLMLGNTLAASFIWGINTLFLLDAGLSNLEAFAANAFFTAGMLIFEIPTGVVADTVGRRASYLLGTVTLAVTTALYWLLWVWESPFWAWAIVSVLLGLGFTFFSGAVDAWLVDALKATGYQGSLETVFGRAQIVGGIAMLSGSVLGGVIAQATNLGVPFLIRAAVLVVMFVVAALLMHDLGFTPDRSESPLQATRTVLRASIRYGLGDPPVRWLMLASPFTAGVGIYVFYALQPYLLELWGDDEAYTVAGLAAALVSGAAIVGGAIAPWVRKLFRRRTSSILLATVYERPGAASALGLVRNFWVAVGLVALWGIASAIDDPVHRAYLNDMIPSKQRATVLSFDSLMGSAGGVVFQPVLGRVADVGGYGASLLWSGVISAVAVPFVLLSRAQTSARRHGARCQRRDRTGERAVGED